MFVYFFFLVWTYFVIPTRSKNLRAGCCLLQHSWGSHQSKLSINCLWNQRRDQWSRTQPRGPFLRGTSGVSSSHVTTAGPLPMLIHLGFSASRLLSCLQRSQEEHLCSEGTGSKGPAAPYHNPWAGSQHLRAQTCLTGRQMKCSKAPVCVT